MNFRPIFFQRKRPVTCGKKNRSKIINSFLHREVLTNHFTQHKKREEEEEEEEEARWLEKHKKEGMEDANAAGVEDEEEENKALLTEELVASLRDTVGVFFSSFFAHATHTHHMGNSKFEHIVATVHEMNGDDTFFSLLSVF